VACADSFILAPGRLTTEEEHPNPSVGQPAAVTDKTANDIVSPAPCNVGMEQSMPRRRYQRGRIINRGKKRKVWVGIFREDRVKTDGTIRRARRSVVLGAVKHVTKLQAIEALRPYLDAVNLVAIPRAKAGRALKNFVEEWKHNVAPTLKPSTVRAAESHLRTHILPTMGEMSLTAINTRNVQAFISALTAKGLTRKTCDNVLQTLSGLIKTAKAWGYIPAVFDRSALSLPREGEKQEERFFTAEQVKQIINASNEPYSTLWAVLGLTGCRAGEVFGLKRTDLDFEKRVIRIRRTLDAATRLMHAPKSRSSSADLPIPEALANRLRTFLAEHWRENEADLLFCNKMGKPMVRNKVALKLQDTLKDLKIERAALHAFRHMAASELLEDGVSPPVVQRQMRHSDPRITLQKYGHVIGEAQRRAVDSLAGRVLELTR
jgi:integrase